MKVAPTSWKEGSYRGEERWKKGESAGWAARKGQFCGDSIFLLAHCCPAPDVAAVGWRWVSDEGFHKHIRKCGNSMEKTISGKRVAYSSNSKRITQLLH